MIAAGANPFGAYTNESQEIGLHGVLSNSTARVFRFDVSYDCQRSFLMLDQFSLRTRRLVIPSDDTNSNSGGANANTTRNISDSIATVLLGAPFESTKFAWAKTCRKPGCQDLCSAHGTCNELYGQCFCPPGYYGFNCEVKLEVVNPVVCPGSNISIKFEYPGIFFSFEILRFFIYCCFSYVGRAGANADWWGKCSRIVFCVIFVFVTKFIFRI